MITARDDFLAHAAGHKYISKKMGKNGEGEGYFIIPTNRDISHHGTDGQKWGIRNGPPYPLTREGRAAIRKQRAEKKAAKKAEAERKLQLKKEKEEVAFKAKKEKMIMGASASEIMKHRGEWTNEELKRIADRLELEIKISSKIPKKKAVYDTLEKFNKYTKLASSFTKDVSSIYSNILKIYNEDKKNKSELKETSNSEKTEK